MQFNQTFVGADVPFGQPLETKYAEALPNVFIRREIKEQNVLHVQVQGPERNRTYGAAFDIAFENNLFGPFMSVIAGMGLGYSSNSLAGTEAIYMQCAVLPSEENKLTAVVHIGEIEALKIRNPQNDTENAIYGVLQPFLTKHNTNYALVFKFSNVSSDVMYLFSDIIY